MAPQLLQNLHREQKKEKTKKKERKEVSKQNDLGRTLYLQSSYPNIIAVQRKIMKYLQSNSGNFSKGHLHPQLQEHAAHNLEGCYYQGLAPHT